MGKDLIYADLLCVYGDMLTDKQRDVLELYYNEDLSLAEIAENTGISRQGVRDSIKRGEETLQYFEQKIGLLRKQKQFDDAMGMILEQAKGLSKALSPVSYPALVRQQAETLVKSIEGNMSILD